LYTMQGAIQVLCFLMITVVLTIKQKRNKIGLHKQIGEQNYHQPNDAPL